MQENEVQVTQEDRVAFARLDDHVPGSMGWQMIVHPTGMDCVGVVAFALHRQQAEDAMRERLIAAVNAERVDAEATGDEGDALYNRALDDAVAAIRAATLSKDEA